MRSGSFELREEGQNSGRPGPELAELLWSWDTMGENAATSPIEAIHSSPRSTQVLPSQRLPAAEVGLRDWEGVGKTAAEAWLSRLCRRS